jgi:MFS family permease
VTSVGLSSSGSGSTRSLTIGMVALVTLTAFEELAVSTAMPVAATALGGVREYALAFSLFITTSLLATVLAGGWADARGPRLPLITGLATFVVGLIVCGIAPDFSVLLAGRAIAGFGAGFQIVAIYVAVSDGYPVEQHPKVFARLSAAWVLPSIIGPAIAGTVAAARPWTWRLVFLGVPPLAVIAWLVMMRGMSGMSSVRPGEGDAEGAAASAGDSAGVRASWGLGLAIGALLMQLGSQHVTTFYGVPLAIVGIGVMAVCAPRLLPRGAFRLRLGLPSVVITRGLLTASFYAAETFLPLLLVTERGLSPARAGLVLTGGAIGWSVGSWLLSQPWLHWSRRRMLVTGAFVLALGVLALVAVGLSWVSPYAVIPIWFVAGMGMGLAYSGTSVMALLLADDGEEGRASASLQLCDGLGGVLGIGIAGAVFAVSHHGGNDGPSLAAIWAGLALVAAGAMAAGSRSRLRA